MQARTHNAVVDFDRPNGERQAVRCATTARHGGDQIHFEGFASFSYFSFG
ncbi:MAG: hypothetical protein AAF384_03165 [Pseudomonadota bacterium]